ncbi:hypothetical protein E5A73_13240 [Sphingomonas gei]|uniref:Glycosyltransferase RgtA/B/C/D-like domain-containing protein n=1 Tax=Sphingomonas gei TaxID=1395960 RepID=A0A4S1XA37_9SPHN|nr:hypothetical protein [Sphingomonas gei]TGX52615.1 hypothetical protein E5A73_13240 [Sphingomonas gei]
MSRTQTAWWETRWFAVAAILLSCVPLLAPGLPPLADLPGHIGRYHIAAALRGSADLQQHWTFEWGLVGNLGVDLIVQLLSPILTAEHATKLVVILIPPLWVSGLILLARRAGGTLSPAAGFAFPLVYGYAFQLGFVNFMLAGGLALHALLLWVALAHRPVVRALLFLPIAFVLWIAHSFGWGMFGLLAFAAEWVRLREAGHGHRESLARAIGWCLPLAWPAALMVGAAPGDGALWDWKAKVSWLPSLLRERWKWYDVGCAILLFGLLWAAVRDRRLRFDPLTGTAALLCLIAFVALPRLIVGGAYVDMRMLAPAVALALVAIRVQPGHARFEASLAIAGTSFFVLRMATSSIAFLLFAGTQQAALEAVSHIPRGTTVLVLVNEACSSQWHSDRLGHIAGIAVARRDAFENGQWALADQQLLRPRHPQAEPYRADPSQLVYPASCEYKTTHFGEAVQGFDRGTFRYVWTLDFPAKPALADDVVLVWANNVSALYAVR